MKTIDQNYFYSLHKTLSDFIESKFTITSNEANQLLNFIKSNISFKEQDIVFFEVAQLLAFVREYPLEQISLSTRLKQDLKMSKRDKSFLRVPFNKIIKRLGGSKWVTSTQCVGCTTVKDCVNLIKSNL